MYLNSPVEFCEATGLRRCDLLGFFTELSLISVDLCTNGLLLELYAFSKKEKCNTNYLKDMCFHNKIDCFQPQIANIIIIIHFSEVFASNKYALPIVTQNFFVGVTKTASG